jgi:hypothetical protein
MPAKPISKSKSAKPKVQTEKATTGKMDITGKQGSGLHMTMALRPGPTAAQLDARQEAAKTKRKASGPPRKGTTTSKIKISEVPPVNPSNK